MDINADLAILMSDVDGIYDRPPKEEGANFLTYFNPKNITVRSKSRDLLSTDSVCVPVPVSARRREKPEARGRMGRGRGLGRGLGARRGGRRRRGGGRSSAPGHPHSAQSV